MRGRWRNKKKNYRPVPLNKKEIPQKIGGGGRGGGGGIDFVHVADTNGGDIIESTAGRDMRKEDKEHHRGLCGHRRGTVAMIVSRLRRCRCRRCAAVMVAVVVAIAVAIVVVLVVAGAPWP